MEVDFKIFFKSIVSLMKYFYKGSENIRFVFLKYRFSCSMRRMVWYKIGEDLGRFMVDDCCILGDRL